MKWLKSSEEEWGYRVVTVKCPKIGKSVSKQAAMCHLEGM